VTPTARARSIQEWKPRSSSRGAARRPARRDSANTTRKANHNRASAMQQT
jgi:hypothetical protein